MSILVMIQPLKRLIYKFAAKVTLFFDIRKRARIFLRIYLHMSEFCCTFAVDYGTII